VGKEVECNWQEQRNVLGTFILHGGGKTVGFVKKKKGGGSCRNPKNGFFQKNGYRGEGGRIVLGRTSKGKKKKGKGAERQDKEASRRKSSRNTKGVGGASGNVEKRALTSGTFALKKISGLCASMGNTSARRGAPSRGTVTNRGGVGPEQTAGSEGTRPHKGLFRPSSEKRGKSNAW